MAPRTMHFVKEPSADNLRSTSATIGSLHHTQQKGMLQL